MRIAAFWRPWRRPQPGRIRHATVPASLLLAIVIAFVLCRFSFYLSVPEFALLDAWLHARPPRPPSPQIALIGVDADLLQQFKRKRDELGRLSRLGQPSACTCATMGRDVLAETVRRLKQAKAKVTALDFVFDLPCPVHDRALLKSLALPGYTVLLSRPDPTPGRYNFTRMPSFLKLSPSPLVASPVLYNPRGVIRGVRLIQEEEDEEAYSEQRSTQKLEVRRVVPPLFAACYMAYRDHPEELPETPGDAAHTVRCLDTDVPVLSSEHVLLLGSIVGDGRREAKNAMLISWAGNIGTFPMYSLKAVLAATPQQLAHWFAGKIVLVGSTADRQLTPLAQPAVPASPPLIDQELPNQRISTMSIEETSRLSAMSGLEVHANALDTLLQRRFIRPLPAPLVWLLMLLVSWLTIYAFEELSTAKAVGVTLLQIGILMLAAEHLMRHDYWLYAFIPSISIALSAITGAVLGFSRARHTLEDLVQNEEARDAATVSMVHDLKQPLSAINDLAQIARMQQQSGKEPPPELIQRILQQVQTALGDIDELLATDPHREISLDLREFELGELARDLAVAQSLKSKIHKVEVQAPEDGVWLTADARYLGRALSNLMDNAIKYWPEGGTIVVEIRREPGQVKIRVIDHGMGIAPEAQSRLFNRYQRAVPAEISIPGTGIGLFSVKRIAEAHGGTVHLISAPGEGSIFVMTLPLTPEITAQYAAGTGL